MGFLQRQGDVCEFSNRYENELSLVSAIARSMMKSTPSEPSYFGFPMCGRILSYLPFVPGTTLTLEAKLHSVTTRLASSTCFSISPTSERALTMIPSNSELVAVEQQVSDGVLIMLFVIGICIEDDPDLVRVIGGLRIRHAASQDQYQHAQNRGCRFQVKFSQCCTFSTGSEGASYHEIQQWFRPSPPTILDGYTVDKIFPCPNVGITSK